MEEDWSFPRHRGLHRPSYALFKPSILIFFILSIASMTRFDLVGSESRNSSPRMAGLICHERPNLSLSHPHGPFSPPSESFSQYSSTSSWDLQSTDSEIPSVNLKCGPPLSATNS